MNDGSATVFNTNTGELLYRLKQPVDKSLRRTIRERLEDDWEVVRAVCFSADGTLLAIGHSLRSLSVWAAETGELRHHLVPQAATRQLDPNCWSRNLMVSSVSISSDSRYAFAGCSDGSACLWDLHTGSIAFQAVDHVARIIALFASYDQVRWATTDGNVWQASSDPEPTKLLSTGESWQTAVFSPTGDCLMTRKHPEQLHRWSIAGTSEHLVTVETPFGFRDDLVPFAFGSHDDHYCHLRTAKSLQLHRSGCSFDIGLGSKFDEVHFSQKHSLIATWGWGKRVELWSSQDGSSRGAFACPEGVCSTAISPDGTLLACGASGTGAADSNSPIYVYRICDGALLTQLEGHTHQIHALAFGPDSQWLISASLDRSVRMWEVTEGAGREVKCIIDESLQFHYLRVLSDGRVLLFFKRGIEVWDRWHRCLLRIPAKLTYGCHVAITPDEQRILISVDEGIDEWSLQDGTRVRRLEVKMRRPMRIPSQSLHREIKASAGASVWNFEGYQFIHQGDGPRGWVTPLNLSADGQLMVLPCADGAAMVTIEPEPALTATFPFDGKLRASWITSTAVKLVNSVGQIYQWNAADGGKPTTPP